MSKQDAAGARAKVVRRGLVVVAVLASLAVIVAGIHTFAGSAGHGDPDPGGRIIAALQPIAGTVPQDATGLSRQDNRAHWDSCDGRKGTFGWSDISVIITFKTITPPDSLISLVDGRMMAIGWISTSTVLGPGRRWTRTLADGMEAHAQLAPEDVESGETTAWELSAFAPPLGQRASGC